MASSYEVERSTVIDAPPADVYHLIADFRNWPIWSPWENKDPKMAKEYHGDPNTVGHRYSWRGNRAVGSGSMSIADIAEPQLVRLKLAFLKPFKSESDNAFTLEDLGDGRTKVTWRMQGQMNRLMSVFAKVRSMDKMVGPDFETGLNQLKAAAEQQVDRAADELDKGPSD